MLYFNRICVHFVEFCSGFGVLTLQCTPCSIVVGQQHNEGAAATAARGAELSVSPPHEIKFTHHCAQADIQRINTFSKLLAAALLANSRSLPHASRALGSRGLQFLNDDVPWVEGASGREQQFTCTILITHCVSAGVATVTSRGTPSDTNWESWEFRITTDNRYDSIVKHQPQIRKQFHRFPDFPDSGIF